MDHMQREAMFNLASCLTPALGQRFCSCDVLFYVTAYEQTEQ